MGVRRGASRLEEASPEIRISTKAHWSRTGYEEATRLTPGSAPALASDTTKGAIKPSRERITLSGKGAERGRSADSTEDSGPMKPGNRAEDKTPTTEDTTRARGRAGRRAESRGRQARMTTWESRLRR